LKKTKIKKYDGKENKKLFVLDNKKFSPKNEMKISKKSIITG